ncbi:hypothetical protein PILCRDRAFT_14766 [Piloderma croceum F 1598]|uniref:Uncharacterized protein n=1 Tax=Piloderma croceum (strain F 1598) TaxID=765440 RepID=A0A0C3F1J9_PILCF|nr:hypothetical protein PILCRDRAFT_14766 [Piloderma croceum F 1598]
MLKSYRSDGDRPFIVKRPLDRSIREGGKIRHVFTPLDPFPNLGPQTVHKPHLPTHIRNLQSDHRRWESYIPNRIALAAVVSVFFPRQTGFSNRRTAASSTGLRSDTVPPPPSPLDPTPPLRIPRQDPSLATGGKSPVSSSSPTAISMPPPRWNQLVVWESSNPSPLPPSSVPPPTAIPRANHSTTMHDSSLHQTWNNIQRKGSVGTISSQDSDLRAASPLLNGSGVTHCPYPRYGRRTYRSRARRGRRSIAEASMVARYGTWTGRYAVLDLAEDS